MSKKTTGMLLGKFMPPHMGHVYLVNFAKSFVDELTVVVGSLDEEPIAGELRFKWMCEMFPDVNIVHLTDNNPQYPEEHPDFWQIWHDSLMRVLPNRPDYVFAGEDYGLPLAEKLGAKFIPSNMGREIVPVSATMIRENPIENWDNIAPAARPYFLRRISIVGAEATGKTVLAKKLAEYFKTTHVPEYAYSYIKTYGKDLSVADFELIAQGQSSSENALEKQARGLLISDTDLIMTEIWAEYLLGDVPETLKNNSSNQFYDLTLLLDSDTEWEDDIHRYKSADRNDFTKKCEKALKEKDRLYIKISGNWEQREQKAIKIIESYLADIKNSGRVKKDKYLQFKE